MYSNILSIGDKIDLSPASGRFSNDEKTQYVSQIMDFTKDQQICITMPIDKGRLILMNKGAKYDLCFYTKRGLYTSRCEVTDRYRVNNVFFVVMKYVTELEKYQRRQFYRLECLMDITYRVITEQEIQDIIYYNNGKFSSEEEKQNLYKKLIDYDKEYNKAVVIDISGGGVRFIASNILQKEQKVMLKIDFPVQPSVKKLSLMANVILSVNVMNHKNQYENRVKFQGISKDDREFIIKYVFDEDRKKRKKEKGLA